MTLSEKKALLARFGKAAGNGEMSKFRDLRVPKSRRSDTTSIRPSPPSSRVFRDGEYDLSWMPQSAVLKQHYEKLIEAGRRPLILDCGANIGFSTMWLAQEFPACKVIAIEPDEENLAMAALKTAGYRNVKLIRGAVWDQSCRLSIINPGAEQWAFQVGPALNGGGIRAYTVNELAGEDPIFIAKIDIEGAEGALFRSNTDWMSRTRFVAIELHEWLFPGAGTAKPFMKAISAENHQMVQRGETLFFLLDHPD
jgi:FkbM family methyltransferase